MIVVVDLENTISDARHRMWLLEYNKVPEKYKNKEYIKQFQESFVDDDINVNVKMFIDSLSKKGHTIVILTAKHERYRNMVAEWLRKYEVKFDVLIMKQSASEEDLEFKRKYIALNRDVISFALDDVGSICAVFGEYGVPCLRIEQK